MSNKTLSMTEGLYQYWLAHGVKEPAVMQALRLETQKLPTAMMQISPEQGQFLTFLTQLLSVTHALELGTFTGYSACAIASGLPENGRLITCDQNKEWTDIAKPFWQQAGLEHKIELRLAPALQTLDQLIHEQAQFDLIFIDADKINYLHYYEKSLTLLAPRSVMLIDNIFFGGAVADPENNLPATRAIRALNKKITGQADIQFCIVPIGDGLTLLRKK